MHNSQDDCEVAEFREWLSIRHGAPAPWPDEHLKALLDSARAKCEALGWGGVFGVAETMLLEQVRP